MKRRDSKVPHARKCPARSSFIPSVYRWFSFGNVTRALSLDCVQSVSIPRKVRRRGFWIPIKKNKYINRVLWHSFWQCVTTQLSARHSFAVFLSTVWKQWSSGVIFGFSLIAQNTRYPRGSCNKFPCFLCSTTFFSPSVIFFLMYIGVVCEVNGCRFSIRAPMNPNVKGVSSDKQSAPATFVLFLARTAPSYWCIMTWYMPRVNPWHESL